MFNIASRIHEACYTQLASGTSLAGMLNALG